MGGEGLIRAQQRQPRALGPLDHLAADPAGDIGVHPPVACEQPKGVDTTADELHRPVTVPPSPRVKGLTSALRATAVGCVAIEDSSPIMGLALPPGQQPSWYSPPGRRPVRRRGPPSASSGHPDGAARRPGRREEARRCRQRRPPRCTATPIPARDGGPPPGPRHGRSRQRWDMPARGNTACAGKASPGRASWSSRNQSDSHRAGRPAPSPPTECGPVADE